jgi:membrane protein DedA with SNARE-associated domain
LTLLGYFLGANQELIHQYLREITIATVIFVVVLLVWYFRRQK